MCPSRIESVVYRDRKKAADRDARCLRSLRILCLQPGRLSELYLEGQRASLLPPARMYLVFSLLLFLFVDVPVPDARQYNLYVGGQLVGRDAEDPSLGRMEIGTTPEGKTLPWLAPILEEKESKLQTMEYGRTWKLTLVQLLFLLMSYFLVLTTVLGLTFATLIFRI